MNSTDQAKQAVRDRVWHRLLDEGVVPPDSYGKIPGFTGAEATAERLAGTAEWQRARTIKANPDWAQLPVRIRALQDDKTLYMAVPRMASRDPFFLLDPEKLPLPPEVAADKRAAKEHAR